eukprot:Gregarina_sp_Pseudo_9__3987@NODE_412_length_2890_cov_8_553139_g389_i0_p2_GENE_NODE_412_length_2890_cov_8_553139_g389_i0NODE_412_length_2890_cov_8_553139_g389_i0_p2_ORF_typecomplete_len303_score10_20ProkRING_4/PF14447_6/0_0058SH3BGR/PF04908_15/8e02SH3BGR/PF04908_15/0_097DZR/PF12773_7/0_12zfRING_5/PF14634_6/0_4_NODE_412_length_2890_cov_8_553139_g389_i018422750
MNEADNDDILYGADIDLDLDAGAEAFLRAQVSQRSNDLDFNLTDIAAEVAREVSQELDLSGAMPGDLVEEPPLITDQQEPPDGAPGGEMDLTQAQELIETKNSSPLASSKRPQLSDNPAEVIALISSLKGVRHDYFASVRLQHFLSRKRIRYVLVDVNKDVIVGRGLRNAELVTQWDSAGILHRNPEGRYAIPQCIIDGVSVGDEIDVQDMEEDYDFDEAVNRTICSECLTRRDPSDRACPVCHVALGPIIPPEIYNSEQIHIIFNDETVTSTTPLPDPHQRIPYRPNFGASNLRPDDMMEY